MLDTTVLITAEREARNLADLVGDEDEVAIAALTVAELLVGVELASNRYRMIREAFVRDVIKLLPVEEYDLDVARVHARLLAHVQRSGCPRGAHDLIIAATAAARRREVVTADKGGFVDLPGVILYNLH
ncbi:MAG: PIN domain-containing protein [Candidatus Dormibacteraceae bacterium]